MSDNDTDIFSELPEDEEDYVIGEGPIYTPYHIVWCPVLEKDRETSLCKTICANQNWPDDKAEEVRCQCPAWQAYQNETEGQHE